MKALLCPRIILVLCISSTVYSFVLTARERRKFGHWPRSLRWGRPPQLDSCTFHGSQRAEAVLRCLYTTAGQLQHCECLRPGRHDPSDGGVNVPCCGCCTRHGCPGGRSLCSVQVIRHHTRPHSWRRLHGRPYWLLGCVLLLSYWYNMFSIFFIFSFIILSI